MNDDVDGPPLTIAVAATLACMWEATAPKPGNVYRGADFVDLTYVDLIASAAVIGPIVEGAQAQGVGAAILEGVQATRRTVGGNANLGILLLLAPLAAAAKLGSPREAVAKVLEQLDPTDAQRAYEAVRLAQPGGLGRVDQADVRNDPPPGMNLADAMRLAADRDLVALQYANQFSDVFAMADRIAAGSTRGWPLADAIVHAFVSLLAEQPDSLIARKCGDAKAQEVTRRCQTVLAAGLPGDDAYDSAVADLDFYLRADGHRRNPGASADLTAAALFVLLLEDRIDWPVRFYR